MVKMKFLLLASAVLGAVSLPAAAAPLVPTCSTQSVVVAFQCSLGNLTFTFEAVNFTGGTGALFLETPPTGYANSVATLGFQVLANYPTDIHLIYEVQSTSPSVFTLDSTFTPFTGGLVAPQINESACGADPTLNVGSCTPMLANVINRSGQETFTSSFGPVSTFWIDKDITDPGFSSFTDSVDAPEPAMGLVLGGVLCGLGLISRKRRSRVK
jgi:hypothetical protein